LADVDAGVAPEPDVVVVPAVAAPNGKKEAPLRDWIGRRVERGAHLLGVCNGSRLLAATGLLDGRRATAHWSALRGLARSRPQVDWVRGQRWAPGDLAYLLAVVFPWLRPTVGVGLVEGVGELEVAAPFEVYASSFAARTVPIAAEAAVTTRHGLRLVATPATAGALRIDRLVVPGVGAIEEVDSRLLGWAADRGLDVELPNGGQAAGRFSFDAMLGDLAGHSDQTTARVTAKSIEYPTEQLELAGAGWPWRPTALLALTATAAIGIGWVPAAATRRRRR
jgi:hypothetical protein